MHSITGVFFVRKNFEKNIEKLLTTGRRGCIIKVEIKERAMPEGEDMNARELAKKHGVSHTLIYNMAKKLGRLPTDEEIENRNRKTGRPQKYRSIEDEDGK